LDEELAVERIGLDRLAVGEPACVVDDRVEVAEGYDLLFVRCVVGANPLHDLVDVRLDEEFKVTVEQPNAELQVLLLLVLPLEDDDRVRVPQVERCVVVLVVGPIEPTVPEFVSEPLLLGAK